MRTLLECDREVSPVEAESDSVDKSVEAGLVSSFGSSVDAESIP